jgi:hypothetical protein
MRASTDQNTHCACCGRPSDQSLETAFPRGLSGCLPAEARPKPFTLEWLDTLAFDDLGDEGRIYHTPEGIDPHTFLAWLDLVAGIEGE